MPNIQIPDNIPPTDKLAAMEQAAHACVYQNGSYDYLDECVNRLANHPGCSWEVGTINYWIRQHYYK